MTDPTRRSRASARRPRPELLGGPYRPDVPDPVACDVDRHHRHRDASLLDHQTRLTVHRAQRDGPVECPVDDIDEQTRDVLASFNLADPGAGEAATVGDPSDVGAMRASMSLASHAALNSRERRGAHARMGRVGGGGQRRLQCRGAGCVLRAAIPEPEQVLTEPLKLSVERRCDVPMTAVCPEYTSDDLRSWVESGTGPVASAHGSVTSSTRRSSRKSSASFDVLM